MEARYRDARLKTHSIVVSFILFGVDIAVQTGATLS